MTTAMEADPLVDVQRVAEQLNISERGVYRLVNAGLPHYRVGHQLRFDLVEVRKHCRREQPAA